MPRKNPAKTAAKKAAPRKAAPRKASAVPEATVDLEVRQGGRIVFLQPVTGSSIKLSFSSGNLRLSASTADAVTDVPEEVDFSQPVDEHAAAAAGVVDPDEEVEINPNVNLAVHTGDRDE